MKFDIVIAGGGATGATTACLLAKQGFNICLLESGQFPVWDERAEHPRVSAINIASRQIFKAVEVWESIVCKRVYRYTDMRVWEHDSRAKIEFASLDYGVAELGYIIENDAITCSLLERLRQNYGVTLLENSELCAIEYSTTDAASGVSLTLANGDVLQCQLLIGADGASSSVRTLCDIDSTSFDYQQDAIVTSVKLQGAHDHTAWQSFCATGPVALLPMSAGHCSLVWSCDRDQAAAIMQLSDTDFCARLSEIFAGGPGVITACNKRLHFPLRQQHAQTYIARAMALVGDAAHATHPLAGLGVNIGLLDAAALAEVIADARRRGIPIHRQSVLRRYERWRKGENAAVLTAMKTFKSVFGSSDPVLTGIRRAGLNLANAAPPLKHQFARYAMGLSGDLPAVCKNS